MYSTTFSSSIDVVTALHQGARDYQEDCIVADFPIGTDSGFAVLADGMGAHASGDLASSLIVGRVFSLLKANISTCEKSEETISSILLQCVEQANATIKDHVKSNPDDRGMGATLVIMVVVRGRLYWASVGDSLLYVVRSGELHRLNEDHSMAPRIQAMVAAGQLSQEKAATHPDRNALTSAIFGAEVARVDCPETPFEMQSGDAIILASDGLQSLRDEEILKTVRRHGQRSSYQLTEALLQAVTELRNPEQDNTSIVVAKYDPAKRTVTAPVNGVSDATAPKKGRANAERDQILEALDHDIEEAPDALLEAMSL